VLRVRAFVDSTVNKSIISDIKKFLKFSINNSLVLSCTDVDIVLLTFMLGGYDRNYKLWNLKAPNLPITSLRRGMTCVFPMYCNITVLINELILTMKRLFVCLFVCLFVFLILQ